MLDQTAANVMAGFFVRSRLSDRAVERTKRFR